MEKRGVSHIEVILSFLLFISASVLALYFFAPAYKTEVISSSMNFAYDSIIKEASTSLESYYVNINPAECKSKDSVKIVILDLAGNGARVEDNNGVFKNSKIDGTSILYQGCDLAAIYLSKDIDSINNCNSCNKQLDGTIASSLTESVMSEKKLNNLKTEYTNNYDSLKNNLNIPSGTNFAFILVFPDGTEISAEKNVPTGLNVYSQFTRLKVLKEDGTRPYAEFQVMVW